MKRLISSVIIVLVVIFIGHYYFVHLSPKRVFASQKFLNKVNYVNTIYYKNDAYILGARMIKSHDYMVADVSIHKNILGWRIVGIAKQSLNVNGLGASDVGKDSRLSYGIIDSTVKSATFRGKILPLIQYRSIRFWYDVSNRGKPFVGKPKLNFIQ